MKSDLFFVPPLRHLVLAGAIFAFLAVRLVAQEAPDLPDVPDDDEDDDEEEVQPVEPFAPAAVAPMPDEDGFENGLFLPNASIIQVVLPIYQNLTGKRIVVDSNIADNNVRLIASGPITREESLIFIEETLLLNGYVFVPTMHEDQLKLINAAAGSNPRSEGVPVVTDEAALPERDQVVSYVMVLRYLQPEEAMRTFQTVAQPHAYASMVAVPNASAVVVTDTTALIRQLIVLKDKIDVPSAQVESKWYTLVRADAERVADTLNIIFDPGAVGQTGARARRAEDAPQQAPVPDAPDTPDAPDAPAPGAAGQQAGDDIASGGAETVVRIIPDRRTNRILVLARPVDISYIDQLIADIDAPRETKNFLERQLEFVTASEFLPLATDAIARDMGDEVTITSAGGQAMGQQDRRGGQQQAQQQQPGRGQQGIGGGGFGSTTVSGSLQAPQALAATSSVNVGGTLIIADNERNTVIVSGPPDHLELIEELLDIIDVRPRQIYISTVIAQMNIGKDRTLGVDVIREIERINKGTSVDLAGQLRTGSGAGIVDPMGLTLDALDNFPDARGLSLYGQIAGNLNAYVRMLERSDDFEILSRPTIYTANNRLAVIQSGQRIAVPTSTLTTAGSTDIDRSITSNITFRDVVLALEVLPMINSQDEVNLQIRQINDTIIGSQTIGNNEVPTIGTQELSTTVTVRNGTTIVLGGLIEETTEQIREGVPFLMNIPLLGRAFSTTTDRKNRQELLVFIQPHIIETESDLYEANLDRIDRMTNPHDALEFAVPGYQDIEPLPSWERPGGDLDKVDGGKQPSPERQRHQDLFHR